MKTKDRILATAKQLFNDKGYGNVTIANLAEALNMTKGNLWYHFNDKYALLEALSNEFLELDVKRRQIRVDGSGVLSRYVKFLNSLSQEIREFRFLFRDHSDYGEHTAEMLQHLPIIYDETQAQFVEFFTEMKKQGHLRIESDAIPSLAINVIIVVRYNLEFMRERRLIVEEGAGAVSDTLLQHLTLFSDKLSDDARRYFETALSANALNKIAS